MSGGRPPLGDKAMTKAERDKRSRQKRLEQWQAMADALAAIASPAAIGTLREARMRAYAVLVEIGGSGTPSSSEQ